MMEASVGFRPSYSWRSICAARDVIRDGLRWRVGNGKSIRVWSDEWIPGQGAGKILSPVRVLPADARVEDLIDVNTRSWDRTLVENIFHSAEASKILRIPLSWANREDSVFWNFTSSGLFTVRSAYSRLMQLQCLKEVSSSRRKPESNFVWKLRIPKKVQHFLFRLLHNALPCQENLKKRKVELEPCCPLCQDCLVETASHLFMTCDWSRRFWWSSHLALRSGDFADGIEAWIQHLKSALPADDFENFVMMVWGVWRARNDMVFNKVRPESQQIMNMALSVRRDWLEHQAVKGTQRHEQASWSPPSEGFLKINIDAGWSGKEGTGYGLVVRNAEGVFQAAATQYVDHRMDPLLAEALCFRWSVQKALDWNLDQLIFSSDCKQLVEAFKSPHSFPILQHIIDDCLNLVPTFTKFDFIFEGRSTNRVAHALAADCHLYPNCSWWGDPPVGILLSLAADSSIS